jgi:GNAT superfamily N-acetyltransferase
MSRAATTAGASEITLREPADDDVQECARICYESFGQIDDHHRFPRDFPTVEFAAMVIGGWVKHPNVWGVLAERDGRILGSSYLDQRGPIVGVGPISVDPEAQNSGVGRRLMEAVIERGKDAPGGVRLLQDSFHMRSLCLYQSLGFNVTEPVVIMSGKPRSAPVDGVEVRRLEAGDIDACEALCKRVHGWERTGELRDAMQAFAPFVVVRDGEVVGYLTTATLWPMAHGVAVSEEDMEALLLGVAAQSEEPLSFLAPIRWQLYRWALSEGLRAMKPMNIMARDPYQEPRGAWFSNVLY